MKQDDGGPWVELVMGDGTLKLDDLCPFCLDELRRGIPENGICGHEKLLEENPHLRFNYKPPARAPKQGE